jgi:hypothetical protein
MFMGTDPAPDPFIIKQKQKEKPWCFLLFCDFFMTFYLWKIDVKVASKTNKQKTLIIKQFLVDILKVTDENSRIRNRIR